MDTSKKVVEAAPLLSTQSTAYDKDKNHVDTRSWRAAAVRRPSYQTMIFVWVFLMVGYCMNAIHDTRFKSIEARAQSVLKASPIIDSHIDLPILIRFLYQNQIYGKNFTTSFEADGELYGQVDIPRLKTGRVGGVFWSVFTSCPAVSADPNETFVNSVYYESIHDTLQQIDLVKRIAAEWPEEFGIALTSAEARSLRKPCSFWGLRSPRRKVASMIGVEGLHQIGNSPATMRLFHELGVRYITLNHNCNNNYSDGALVPAPHWGGLNPATGPALIYEMNRIGMLVDLAHTSADTMRDVLAITQAPVIFSHSSAFAICPHPRNVPDDVLQLVKKNGGIVMVNFYPIFIRCGDDKDAKDATIDDVVEHMMYIGQLIGWRHVGIGSDFDGIESVPKGLEDVSKYPKLFEELLKKGVTEKELIGVAGENVLRVWGEAEKVGAEMIKNGAKVLEDVVQRMHF